MDVLPVMAAVVYLALAAYVGVRATRTDQPALWRLTWFVAAIGVVAGTVPLVGENGDSWLGVVAMLAGLALYPALLLRLGAALAPEVGPLERLALAALAIEVAVLATTPVLLAPLDALMADMVAIAVVAAVAHVVVHVVLERQVRRLTSSFVRRRARALQAGLGLLAVSLVGGVLLDFVLAQGATVLAAGAAGLLSAATAPPRWLQAAFAVPDHDRLAEAEEAVATADDPEAAVANVLRALMSLATGRAAWLDVDGQRVAAVGVDADAFTIVHGNGNGVDRPVRVVGDDGATLWQLHANARAVDLYVVAGRDPVLYGLSDADLLPRAARRLAIVLEGRRMEADRRAQERAEQEAEHFRRVAALKDDLISTMNHELRTPLGMVTAGLELVTARWEDLPLGQLRTLVERIDANAQDLAKVVYQVLHLMELRSGMTQVKRAPVELAPLLERVSGDLDRAGRVHIECPAMQVAIDEELTTRVLVHLVDNALRHTDGAVRVVAGTDDHRLRLSVSDQGTGIDDDLLAPLQRGGHYLRRATRGIGIGLSLVVETVELLDGEVIVDSDAAGTTVACTIPLPDVATADAAARLVS